MAEFHCFFLWRSSIPTICLYHIFFIHSSADGHLDCSHILAVVNSAAMHIGVHVSFRISGFIFSRYIPRSGIAGSYTSSIFNFVEELPYRFPYWLHRFTFPSTVQKKIFLIEGKLNTIIDFNVHFSIFFLIVNVLGN